MTEQQRLNESLKLFFDGRAAAMPDNPTLEQLCAASCKETRLWARREIYDDLMSSIQDQLDLRPEHRLLEIGCAAGFLAVGLSRHCGEYVGIDVSPVAISRAKQLKIDKASFLVADGANLPFEMGTFDRVISYDVFTNFPNMEVANKVADEMLRVTAPKGKTMIGAIPDAVCGDSYFKRAQEVSRELDKNHGPRREVNCRLPSLLFRCKQWYARRIRRIEPTIVNFLFSQDEFRSLGAKQGVDSTVLESHALSPFRNYRFNVVFSKRKAAA